MYTDCPSRVRQTVKQTREQENCQRVQSNLPKADKRAIKRTDEHILNQKDRRRHGQTDRDRVVRR